MPWRRLDGKLRRDLLATYGSLVLLAICGLIMNIWIAVVYGAEVLGAFNLTYAIYMVAAQVASFGIDVSATKMAAEEAMTSRSSGGILLGSLCVSAIVAVPTAIIVFVAASVEAAAGGGMTPEMLIPIALAIPLLTFNRVFVGVANGERRMNLVALVQGTRYLLLVLGVAVVASGQFDANRLGWIFVLAEAPIFVGLLIGPYRTTLFSRVPGIVDWMLRLSHFSLAGFVGAVVVELNLRVDVLMLGWLVDDREVGIYSLAAVIVEGISQFIVVIALSLNPLIARKMVTRDVAGLRAMIAITSRTVYLVAAAVLSVLVIAYPFILPIFVGRPEFIESWPMFAVLAAGLLMTSGYLPFRQFPLFAGRPGWYSAQIFGMASMNALLNILLVPALGGIGASIAVGIGQVTGIVLLATIASHILRMPLPLPWDSRQAISVDNRNK